ncbi:MAG: hypothetical protein SF052_21625 [Bacteroidia bacterium]|nr:hypothetical protein [Bacteroidia bacterium]
MKRLHLFLLITFFVLPLLSQPVISAKQMLEGFEIYPDFKTPNVYYYAPGKLTLGTESNGRPQFQLVEMRYTGTACTDDQGQQRFLNLAQFTIRMTPMSPQALSTIRQTLTKGRITPTVKPLPIRYIESFLVTAVGKDADEESGFRRIAKGNSFGAETASGNTGTYWSERTFTLKLENFEAQLLWDQISTGKLSVSFGYAFYADAVFGNLASVSISGDSAGVAELNETVSAEELAREGDTTVAPMVIRSDAFAIMVDVVKWPEALKKLDINEGMPPAYPAVQVACYDFSDGLRPDLSLKKIEVEAIGVGGQPLAPVSARFSKGNPDMNLVNLNFPFAVRMDRPMRYRLVEFSQAGEKTTGPWIEKESCAGLIDVTTQADDNLLERKNIEFEADTESMKAAGIVSAECLIAYFVGDKPVKQSLRVSANDVLPIQALTFTCGKNPGPVFRVDWKKENGETIKGFQRNLQEDYYYLTPPVAESNE